MTSTSLCTVVAVKASISKSKEDAHPTGSKNSAPALPAAFPMLKRCSRRFSCGNASLSLLQGGGRIDIVGSEETLVFSSNLIFLSLVLTTLENKDWHVKQLSRSYRSAAAVKMSMLVVNSTWAQDRDLPAEVRNLLRSELQKHEKAQ